MYKRDDKEFKKHLAEKHDKIQQEKTLMKTVLTHKKRKAAKKLFPKKAHSTRAFGIADYDRLPKGK